MMLHSVLAAPSRAGSLKMGRFRNMFAYSRLLLEIFSHLDLREIYLSLTFG